MCVCVCVSAWFVMYFVFPLCIFEPTFRLSEFTLFRCFSICFIVSFKRATSSANLKLLRFSPSTLTPSDNNNLLKYFDRVWNHYANAFAIRIIVIINN